MHGKGMNRVWHVRQLGYYSNFAKSYKHVRQVTIHIAPPSNDTSTTMVRMTAPALSLVVIGLVYTEPSVVVVPELPVPAVGSLVLFPPVDDVNGAAKDESTVSINDEMTPSADICCPTPYVPSHVVVFHSCPQVTPSVPPSHCCAAPAADASRYGMMVSYVDGTSWVVTASQRER